MSSPILGPILGPILAPALAFTLLLAAACSPAERVSHADDRPALVIKNATAGSRLAVDGVDFGPVGDDAVLLEPGTHLVTVTGPNGETFSEKLFMSGRGLRTVTVPAGTPR